MVVLSGKGRATGSGERRPAAPVRWITPPSWP